MAPVGPVELASEAGPAAERSRAERSKLRRELGRLDAVCLLIAAIVVLDTLGAVARGGALVETPVWVGGSAAMTAVAVVDRLIVPLEGGWRVAVALASVWVTVALAVAPLKAGKKVPLVGTAAQVGLLGFLTATVAAYAVSHGVHGPAAGDFVPSWAVFVLVAPVLVYKLPRLRAAVGGR